jgi:hypothetical protein
MVIYATICPLRYWDTPSHLQYAMILKWAYSLADRYSRNGGSTPVTSGSCLKMHAPWVTGFLPAVSGGISLGPGCVNYSPKKVLFLLAYWWGGQYSQGCWPFYRVRLYSLMRVRSLTLLFTHPSRWKDLLSFRWATCRIPNSSAPEAVHSTVKLTRRRTAFSPPRFPKRRPL